MTEDNKEGLKDQLSKPFQRLTRYKLLLERIKDESTELDEKLKLEHMVYLHF